MGRGCVLRRRDRGRGRRSRTPAPAAVEEASPEWCSARAKALAPCTSTPTPSASSTRCSASTTRSVRRASPELSSSFATWRNRPVLSDDEVRRRFVERLNTIPGVDIPLEKAGGNPTFPLTVLADAGARGAFTGAGEMVDARTDGAQVSQQLSTWPARVSSQPRALLLLHARQSTRQSG